MKKYSTEYFEDKYMIILNRLLEKDGFIEDIKLLRKDLEIPENGFKNEFNFFKYFIKILSDKEKESISFYAYVKRFEKENNTLVNKKQFNKLLKEFNKYYENDFDPVVLFYIFEKELEDHSVFFTQSFLFEYCKKTNNLFVLIKKILSKFMFIDLLDSHIIFKYIENYLFLGEDGVKKFIKEKLKCPHCKYIGVSHFSPDGCHMEGRKYGPFTSKYLFNKDTVKLLSNYFDSVFVIIRPYASKEQVISYINENWNDLKEHIIEKNTFYKQFDINCSKIKKSDYEKNRTIYELYKLSKKDLIKKYKGTKELSTIGIYKEDIISAILKDELNIEMTADAIKKSATRFAKSTKLKQEPKDIRDI